ncbi:Transcription factor atf21 [Fusarium austroafricanum]|uniref:Transcription factor atf21 n=1 Tax=Fusarium austroafricanum TaxID=2364996 RepID=A0A8H4PAQ0_9HYPO|nr:Transcription factor atf21 [Fusarium austroafricanum]
MDLPFGNPMNVMTATPSPGYIMTPSPYYTRTPSPTNRGNIGYQPALNQIQDPSFFEEAMGGSPLPQEMALGIMQPPFQYSSAPNAPNDYLPSRVILPSTETEQKPVSRARNRKPSQLSISTSKEVSAPVPAPSSPKQKKRGRKPKGGAKDSGKAREEIELDEDDLPKDPRRRRILERNRIAATKCRLRKRDEASALASQEQAMEDQNRYLSSCFDSLTAEIYHLKTQLLQHTDCNCVLIQKYIANEAKKTVDGLLSCSSAFQPDNDPMSPYRRGSCNSGTSPTESLGVPTPEFEGVSPTWSQPFQTGHASSSDVSEEIFEVPIDHYHKSSIQMHGQSLASMTPLHHHESEVFVGMGPPPQHVEGINWNPSWGF